MEDGSHDIFIVCLESVPPPLTRIRLMPARVTCWQSYSSSRSRPRQFSRCSRATSVMRRQLSNSSTRSLSWPQVLLLRCRIPSSVMSSQWDRLWNRETCADVCKTHSFRGCRPVSSTELAQAGSYGNRSSQED